MANFKEYKTLNLPEIDKEILQFWETQKIFDKSVNQRSLDNSFVFYEGPPSANGKPGIHHVMARTIKDVFCRFQTLKGKRVERKGGWDTHGLPIELSVEKELGITKEDIGKKISVDDYNKACRETVLRYKDLWDNITQQMGYWVDLENPYITFENNYIESVWNLLKKLYDKNLLYKGYTIQPYSPAAGTGLSSHELNQPGTYKDVKDTTIVAQFKMLKNEQSAAYFKGAEEGEVHFLAWTTTPWTLPSNTALTVGPKIDYALVQSFNQYTHKPIQVILAKGLVGKQFSGKYEAAENQNDLNNYQPGDKKIPYFILKEMKGSELVGIKYEQLMPFALPYENADQAFRVIPGDFVTTEDGTGIVHTAPTFGADDAMVAKKAGVPAMLVLDKDDNPVPLVDKQGKFRPEMGDFAGKYVKNEYYKNPPEKSVDVELAIKLKEENKAFKVEKYAHTYPHCWRTDKPVLYYPLDSWFIRATACKERMYELNKTINWKPASTGEGRFGKWLENLQDWNLSRSRFWGIPLPIWRNEDGTEEVCIGSIEQLQQEVEKANAALGLNQSVPDDLHRPYIDDVVLVSPSGKEMRRELDLIDVWFDSGSMPYAQWHYPFENEEKFKRNFPADFIAEGVDQTRGWFYTLHAIATMVHDSVAFKNVVSNGLVLDKDGKKMSKRLGNGVDPFATLDKYGADATRWYMISNSPPWDNLKFDLAGLDEVRRKFFGTLHNTYSFFALYANIDGYQYGEENIPLEERSELDRWVISLLNTLVKETEGHFADYDATPATRKIQNFVNDQLSNWYVRLSRRRFWKGEFTKDKKAAYQTLYECLLTVTKLMASVAPFYADFLYKNLTDKGSGFKESVHLEDFPEVNDNYINKNLEQQMDYAQRISSLVLSLRKKEKIRVRQPLGKILLPVLDEGFKNQVEKVKDLVLAEVNVKELEYITETEGVIKKKIKPNFRTLGRRLGPNMKLAAQTLGKFGQNEIAELEKAGGFDLNLPDGSVERLGLEDVEITSEDIPGWLVANDGPLTVALDVTMTDQLLAEGTARELINRIQNIRKESNFNVTDRIAISIEKHEAVESAVSLFGNYICNETLATDLQLMENLTEGQNVSLATDVDIKMNVVRREG